MREDIAYLDRILDDCDNFHLASALRAHQRIDLVDLREKPCSGLPPCVHGDFFAVIERLEAGVFRTKYSEYFVWKKTRPFNDSEGRAMYCARLALLLTSVRRTELETTRRVDSIHCSRSPD